MDKIYTKTFESGLRLVYQRVGNTKPTAIYIYVNTGSVNEDDTNRGVSHFIEHLTFKGTYNRTSKEISKEFDSMGALVNAATGKFTTKFYATCLPETFEKTLNVLTDLVFNSKYDEKDIETERKVIFEEIDMYKDDPYNVLQEHMDTLFYKGTGLDTPILGTKESLTAIKRENIVKYVEERYVPENIVVSITGSETPKKVEKLVKKYINDRFKNRRANVAEINKSRYVVPDKVFDCIKKDVAQLQLLLNFPADNIYSDDADIYPLMSMMMGLSESSRLFQKLREENGLVYTVSCSAQQNRIGGNVEIYFGTNEKNAEKALKMVKDEIDKILAEGFTEAELSRSKAIAKSVILSGGQTTSSMANSMGSQLISFNRLIDKKEKLQKMNDVTLDDVNRLAKKIFNYANICGCVISKNIDESIFDIFN